VKPDVKAVAEGVLKLALRADGYDFNVIPVAGSHDRP